MKNINFGFVVLHYQAFDMTVECVETLKSNFKFADKAIVIVDNKSPNGSGALLAEKYALDDSVKVIQADENYGFARGNNIGYDYLKKEYNVNYIIAMNNDVLIKQKDFFDVVESIYKNEEFAVLGPDIYCPKVGIHQNPFRLNPIGKTEFKKMFFIERLKKFFGYSFFTKIIQPVLDMRHKNNNKNIARGDENYKIKHINPVLHGSCVIFSKKFINNREYAFNPLTYMFFEENILHFECMKSGLKTVFSPEIQINHMEDVSTDMVFKKNVQKENWKSKNTVNSMKLYKLLLEGCYEQDSK